MAIDLPLPLNHSFAISLTQGVQRRMVSVVNFFLIFEIIVLCFIVAIFDLVHDVEATIELC